MSVQRISYLDRHSVASVSFKHLQNKMWHVRKIKLVQVNRKSSERDKSHTYPTTHTPLSLSMAPGCVSRSSGLMKYSWDSSSAFISSHFFSFCFSCIFCPFFNIFSFPVFHPVFISSVLPLPLRSYVFCSYSSHHFLFYKPPHLHSPPRPPPLSSLPLLAAWGHAAVN